MKITAITAQKRRSNRVNVFIDGVFVCALDLETLVKNGLKVNQELTSIQLQKLINESEFARWYNQVLSLLSSRPRSVKEIKDYLVRKEAGEQTTKMVIGKLVERKLVDDTAFAQWFIEQRQSFRPKGKRALAAELSQKGIAKDIIESVLSDTTFEKETEAAVYLLEKKLPHWQKLPKSKCQEKAFSYLARRGYNWEVIKSVWQKLASSG